ncbi:hypothetical protein [Vibrio vulnificus]|uniref:hypothetical protein n=1 Tax=Vibrio vulnificus TaxID=672 RepID=UPI001EEC5859|nr:hypothetical protein [Vibrio vulnificus]MCG6288865.1 hypothetical protein [Vibrio vulnificus]
MQISPFIDEQSSLSSLTLAWSIHFLWSSLPDGLSLSAVRADGQVVLSAQHSQ